MYRCVDGHRLGGSEGITSRCCTESYLVVSCCYMRSRSHLHRHSNSFICIDDSTHWGDIGIKTRGGCLKGEIERSTAFCFHSLKLVGEGVCAASADGNDTRCWGQCEPRRSKYHRSIYCRANIRERNSIYICSSQLKKVCWGRESSFTPEKSITCSNWDFSEDIFVCIQEVKIEWVRCWNVGDLPI